MAYLMDVESLMDIAEHLSIMHSSGNLLSSLIFGAKWLKNVSEVISAPRKFKACNLTDADEMLAEYQGISISFPMMVAQLTDATCKYRLWQEQVHQFFSLELGERPWSQIMQLKVNDEVVLPDKAFLYLTAIEDAKYKDDKIEWPKSRATHWKQMVLYLEDVLTICEAEAIIGSMTVAPNKKNPRDVDIMVKYSLSGRRCVVSRV